MNENNELKEFSSGGSKYFKPARGADIFCKYLFYEVVPNRFDGGKSQCVQYHLEIDGEQRIFSSTSKALAQKISKVPQGSKIKMNVQGEGTHTKYSVEVISDSWE